MKHFLGLEVDHTEEGIPFHQQRYSRDLLEKFGMFECKPIVNPMEPKANICSREGKDLKDVNMYRKLVSSLIYPTLTKLDISYAASVMSRYMKSPKKSHLERVQQILRYVKGTLEYDIFYKKSENCTLIGYHDVDFARDHDTQHSTIRCVFMIGARPVSSCCKR